MQDVSHLAVDRHRRRRRLCAGERRLALLVVAQVRIRMFARISPALVAFVGSVLLLAGLLGALYWTSQPNYKTGASEPLEIYCAAAMVKTIEAVAKEYEAEFGQPVILHPGPSRAILVRLEDARKGDLFL